MDLLERCLIAKIAVDEALAEQDREEKWHAFVKQTEPIEDKFKPVLRTAFTKQEKSVLSAMRGKPVPDTSKAVRLWFKAASDEANAAAQAYLGDKFDPADWQTAFETMELPFVTEAFAEAGAAAYTEIGFQAAFNVTNPQAANYLDKKVFQFAKSVNETTESALRRTLAQGFDKGEGIREISQRVADVFEIAKGSRTNTIARTEIVGASNNGTYNGYIESGLVKTKVWIDSRDARVRTTPHNHALDGEEVEFDKRFSNGLLHPHGPGGAAGNVINCRCTIAAGEIGEAGKTAEDVRQDVLRIAEKEQNDWNAAKEAGNEFLQKAEEARKAGDVIAGEAFSKDGFAKLSEAIEIRQNMGASTRELFAISENNKIVITFIDDTAGAVQTRITKNVQDFADMVSGEVFDGVVNKEINILTQERVRAAYAPSTNRMRVSSTSSTGREVIHELGHWLENQNPEIRQKATDFLGTRTKGKQAKTLGNAFNSAEKAKDGGFIDDYMGRIYESDDTEIISMGMDKLYSDPYKLAKEDPEYFRLIYNILRGIE